MNVDYIINTLVQDIARLSKEKAILTAKVIELENKIKEVEQDVNA